MSEIKFTVIGSGVTLPTKSRKSSSFLIECDNTKILLDCGYGTLDYLIQNGINPHDIDAIFVSHFHPDHFVDCFTIVNARYVDDLYNDHTNKKINIWGPDGIKERKDLWSKIYGLGKFEIYPIIFTEGPDNFIFNNIGVEIFEVEHSEKFQSVAVNLVLGEKKISYFGDLNKQNTKEFLIDKLKNADLFITSAFAIKEDPNLYTLDEFAEIATKSNCPHVLATHIRPSYEEFLVGYQSKIIQKASDGLEIKI